MFFTYPRLSLSDLFHFLDVVIVNFKAVGAAPLLKQTKFRVSSEQTVSALYDFLRRQLNYTGTDPLVPLKTYNIITLDAISMPFFYLFRFCT